MTAPYDWARDPGAFPPAKPVEAPRPVGQLHRVRCLVPAVWLRFQPKLGPVARCDYRHGALQVQWRWPHRGDFFRGN